VDNVAAVIVSTNAVTALLKREMERLVTTVERAQHVMRIVRWLPVMVLTTIVTAKRMKIRAATGMSARLTSVQLRAVRIASWMKEPLVVQVLHVTGLVTVSCPVVLLVLLALNARVVFAPA